MCNLTDQSGYNTWSTAAIFFLSMGKCPWVKCGTSGTRFTGAFTKTLDLGNVSLLLNVIMVYMVLLPQWYNNWCTWFQLRPVYKKQQIITLDSNIMIIGTFRELIVICFRQSFHPGFTNFDIGKKNHNTQWKGFYTSLYLYFFVGFPILKKEKQHQFHCKRRDDSRRH